MENSQPEHIKVQDIPDHSPQPEQKTHTRFSVLRAVAAGIFVLTLIIFSLYFSFNKPVKTAGDYYSERYRLVPEEISKSASISISLPKGADKSAAEKGTTFNPEIKGTWVEKKQTAWWQVQNVLAAMTEQKINTNLITFQPADPLDLNKHYSVTVDLGGGKILSSDFLTKENPKIVSIFPATDSEAPDTSKITIVFNRPMVPVTTLSELENQNIPVEITPSTDGKFKWIGTNTLQFIPKTRLTRSSNYTVKVKKGFTSMDGLAVDEFESHFQVLKIRFADGQNEGQLSGLAFNQPVKIYFNQPVSLTGTKKLIRLADANNNDVAYNIQYGKKPKQSQTTENKQGDNFSSGMMGINYFNKMTAGLLDFMTGGGEEVDQTVLEIIPQKDSFNRANFWDFNKGYTLYISGAVPTEGDLVLDQNAQINITTADVVSNWTASSERTNWSSLDMFDPSGFLTANFSEDVDLSRLVADSSVLKKKEYGKKCLDPENYDTINCTKTDDHKTVNFYFNAGAINPGDQIKLTLEKVFNDSGLQINRNPVTQVLNVYKKLSVTLGDSSKAYDNLGKKNLNGFALCSNNPIMPPEKKDLSKALTGFPEFILNSFYNSSPAYDGAPCPAGTFLTWVHGGFSPDSSYDLNLNVTDVFNQSASQKISFQTGAMEAAGANLFALQQNYSITSPSDTVLNFAAQNLDYVNLKICKMKAVGFIMAYSKTWDNTFTPQPCEETQIKKIDLPKKYWLNNYFPVDIKDYFPGAVGNYIVTLSSPLVKDKLTDYVSVTNLALAEKAISSAADYLGDASMQLTSDQISSLKNLYWVTNLKTQDPVSGATVEYFDMNGSQVGQSATTNGDGLAFSQPAVGVNYVVATSGDDSAALIQNNDNLNWAGSSYNYRKTYIYTDKPLYRPEQTVHVKGIMRLGYDGNYQIRQEKTVNIKVQDPKYSAFLEKSVNVDSYGAFNLDFILDKDASLGTYTVCVDGSYECAYFDILEYVPAAFQVTQTADKKEYVSKDTANIKLQAAYYFGAPVDNSKVTYTFSSQHYYFDKYKGDEWFNFGSSDDAYYYTGSYYYGDRFISRGSGTTDKDGNFNLSKKMDLQQMINQEKDAGSKIIVLDSTVQNNLGQSVSNQQSFIVHQGLYYIGVKTDPYFVGKNQEFNIKAKTVDDNGAEMQVSNISADVYVVSWNYAKRQEVGGTFNYVWEQKKDKVKSFTFNTDSKGNYSQKLKLDKEGEYSIELSSTDSLGNKIQTKTSIYVYGSGQASFSFDDTTSLTIKADKTDLKPGEKGQIIIQSPWQKAKALITIERGKVFQYKIVDVTGNILGYDFTATDDYSPNVYVSVLLQSPEPAVKFGTQEFKVNSSKNKINLTVTSDKKYYQPGDTVNMKITAKDDQGNPQKAEVSLSVVDLSVLALKGNPKKDPFVFFYDGLPLAVSTSSNIKDKISRIEPSDISAATKGGSGGGGGDEKVRGDFRETAFWNASVETKDDGTADISFKLPDNLTTWQTEALGVTKDTKLGVSYVDFQTKKDLMVVPLKPRFIIPEDTFSVGAQIFNETDTAQTFKVAFKSDTLLSADNNVVKNIQVEKNGHQTVYFAVKAPASFTGDSHSFTISADGKNNLHDAVMQSITVRQNSTYEVMASASYTMDSDAREVIYLPSNVSTAQGELTVRSSATLAVFLSDALNYLIDFPYGCSEQISSKLKAIAIIKDGLKIPNIADKFKLKKVTYKDKEYTVDQVVDMSLADLYKNQNYDGGFNWWGNGQSDVYVTMKVVEAMSALKKSGYTVDSDIMTKAINYLYAFYNDPHNNLSDEERISLASVMIKSGTNEMISSMEKTVTDIVSDDSKMNDKLSQLSLVELGEIVTEGQFSKATVQKINNALDNRINIDSRGAFLQVKDNNFYYSYFESSISDTALYLKSIADGQRDMPVTDKVIRWLINSRDRDGAWGSTQNTLAVVEAFTDYLNWKKETTAKYTLDTVLNDKKIDSFTFKPETILDQTKQVVPVKSMKVGDYNTLEFKKDGTGSLYYDMAFKYYLTGNVEPKDEGFTITRNFYAIDDKSSTTPLSQAKAGDIVREHLSIVAPVERRNVQIEDFIPAGMEIVDLSLATEDKSLRLNETEIKSPEIYPDYKAIYDNRAYVYTSLLSAGVYEFDYYLRALVPGKYTQPPAMVSEIYTPENFGRTGSASFTVVK